MKKLFYIIPVGFLLLFIFAEFGFRVLRKSGASAPDFFYPSTRQIGYQLRSDYEGYYYHGNRRLQVITDSIGNRELSGQGQCHSKIHIVGDSQVFGWGLSNNQSIAYYLDSLIRGDVCVINYGVPGYGPFAYKEIINNIPIDETVVLLFSESNDLWNSYSALSNTFTKCGYLVSESSVGNLVPCFLLKSHFFQFLMLLRNAVNSDSRPLPLAYNPYTAVSSKMLEYRLNSLFETDFFIRGDKLIAGVIPWDGAIIKDRTKNYKPRISKISSTVEWADSLNIKRKMIESPDSELFFQPDDSHLSAEGSRFVASIIYENLKLNNVSIE